MLQIDSWVSSPTLPLSRVRKAANEAATSNFHIVWASSRAKQAVVDSITAATVPKTQLTNPAIAAKVVAPPKVLALL